MKVIFGAQSFGFGPASKMVTVAKAITKVQRIFIGDGIALKFTKKNRDLFIKTINRRTSSKASVVKVIRDSDFLVIVMDHELAFMAYQLGKRYYFIDSLFGFWYSKKNIMKLLEQFSSFKKRGKTLMTGFYNSLEVHERILLAHYLSEKSFIQSFFGVEERATIFKNIDQEKFRIINPIVENKTVAIKKPKRNGLLLVNVGGVINPFITTKESDYLKLIEKVTIDITRSLKYIKKVIICSGLYYNGKKININGKTIICTFMKKDDFINKVRGSQLYLSSAGLTGFYEALYLYKPTIYLPEQHASQHNNIEKIKKTFLKKYCVSLSDIIGNKKISKNDYRGSSQIFQYIALLLKSEKYYSDFRDKLLQRIKNINALNYQNYVKRSNELISQLQTGIDYANIPNIISENEKKYAK